MVYRQKLLLHTIVLFIIKYQYILKYIFDQCLTGIILISVEKSVI